MFARIQTLLVILGAVFMGAKAIGFTDCGSEFYVDTVDIEGCNRLPCYFVFGEKYNITFTGTSLLPSQQMRHLVYIKIRSLYVSILVTPEDACSTVNCPLANGQTFKFRSVIHVNETLAPLDATLYWRTYNQNNKEIICMYTSLELVDPDP